MKILKEYNYKGYDIEYPTHGGAYGVTVAKGGKVVREFADEHDAEEWIDEENESLTEDTVKTSNGKWTNKGKEGTHGKFKTKKQADAQRKAMFANGYKAESSETDKLYNESLDETAELNEATDDYSGVPLIDKIDFRNKRVNGMPGIYPTKDFIKALNDVGEDFFKVRTTKFGSNLSDADLNDEWMTLKRYGWSIQKVNDSSLEGFNEVYLCKKIKQQESLDEDLNSEDAGFSSVITDLINQEYSLMNLYDSAQVTFEDKGETRFSEIFNYIADDINIHIGMLQACLEDLNGSSDKTEEGEQKADQLLNLDESLFD